MLLEVGNTFKSGDERLRCGALLLRLRDAPGIYVLPPSEELCDAGVRFFVSRPDKTWSLTDCISFAVMRDRGMTQALSSDHHFEQAGFEILLK